MLTFLADENFHGAIVRGLQHHQPGIDIIRAQDVDEMLSADDPVVLDWAARTGRILLTHDVATVRDFAYERVQHGLPITTVALSG